MKSLSKYLSVILMSIFCSMMLISCGGNNTDPDDPDGPQTEDIYSIVIGEKQYEIKSAGCYYSEDNKGYNFVLSSESLDFTKSLTSVPKGALLAIDIPKQYCGKEYDLKDVKDVMLDEENGWMFYLIYTQDGVSTHELRLDNGEIESGKISLTIGLHMKVKCELTAVLKDGTKLECMYDGRYQKSDVYICDWID